MYKKACIVLTKRTLVETLGQALACTSASTRVLAQNTLGLTPKETIKTITVQVTKKTSTLAQRHLERAPLILYITRARNLVIMLLAARNGRRTKNIRNTDQKLRFSRYSNIA